MIIPDGFKGVFIGAASSLNVYGFPVAVMCPENTIPLVTAGDAAVGKSVGCTHFILPVLMSIAVIVPLPMPFSIASNTGSACPPCDEKHQHQPQEHLITIILIL
jgi:hypothetical protein